MVKYSARVWSSRSVNMAAEEWDNDKYPAAKTTRNRGMTTPKASTARNSGSSARMIRRACPAKIAANNATPAPSRKNESAPERLAGTTPVGTR